MATNGVEIALDRGQASGTLDRSVIKNRPLENDDSAHGPEDFALAPLVDKIAYTIARGLVVAVKELENHISGETRKVGDAVDRRLDAVQASLEDLAQFVVRQQSLNVAVQEQLDTLSSGLKESDGKQTAAVETLRTETAAASAANSGRIDAVAAAQKEADARRGAEIAALSASLLERIENLCKDLGVHQEDLSAIKAALAVFSARMDGLMERLDRQAEAVRSMYTSYSQRETELEQLVDGLARLRAFPAPMPSNGL